ncbi:MAG: TonB-dependent receptor [Nitrosomonas sp.]|nr:TonB-dependent receptor [Nitrosomonas sp.]
MFLPSTIRKDSGFKSTRRHSLSALSWLSVYDNWTTSFGANNGISAAGTGFDPQIGEQFEVGIKKCLVSGKADYDLNFYNLTKDNL